MNVRAGGVLIAIVWAGASCASKPAATEPPTVSTAPVTAPAPPPPTSAPAEPAPVDTHVAILELDALGALDPEVFSLGVQIAGTRVQSNAELAALNGPATIVAQIVKDIRSTAVEQPPARVTSIDGWRLFDERWLSSEEMSFALTGVFNRIDRRAFDPSTCGEIRFLYRLGYQTEQGGAPMAGRLPMTINVVYDLPGTDCTSLAKLWQSPVGLKGPDLTQWLTEKGALSATARAQWQLKAVETNIQTIRLQSTVHPALGGHIEYDMRVFYSNESRTSFTPASMENMPDVARLSDPALREELLRTLRREDMLAALDRGTLKLPDRFMATHAVSVSPRALTRSSNRPFSQVFEESDFADLDLSGYQTIRSPAALLRRLDGASCTGCHQSRSIAGFHHVGRDRDDAPAWSALLDGSSTHLLVDLDRRRAYVEAVAAGQPTDEFRPIPERQGMGSQLGAPCGLGDPGFADWTCDDGLECVALEDDEVGVCSSASRLGGVCELGKPVAHHWPHKESTRAMRREACGDGLYCNPNISGFPLGFCSSSCEAVEGSALGVEGACSAFLDIDGLQTCLRYGFPLDKCADEHVLDVGVPACDRDNPCRQDYVCARTPKGDTGACVPPYFVFALRADGYPLK